MDARIGVVDLFAGLRARQNDLARREDEEDHLGFYHSKDETWESLRVIIANVLFLVHHSLLLVVLLNVMEHFFQVNAEAG